MRSAPDDLAKLGFLPLAATPGLSGHDDAVHALAEPRSPLTEAFQEVPALLDAHRVGSPPKRLVLTSSMSGEGRSVAALGIARAFAKKGEKVLLIDADLRSASLHKILEVEPSHGFGELLAGTADAVRPATIRLNMDFLPAGQVQTNPSELLAGADIDGILARVGEKYDRIIIDTPPLAACADAFSMASYADALALVVEANRTEEATLLSSLRRLSAVKPPAGAILTKYDPRMAGE